MTFSSRTALAALVLCSGAPVLAQNNVQMYGRINTAVEYQSFAGYSATGLTSSDSVLGFQGAENLGGGHHAGFVLEMTWGADDGSAGNTYGQTAFKRRSEINFGGNWGLLRMGSFDRASYLNTVQAVQWQADRFSTGSDTLGRGDAYGGNILAYRTPLWAGWQAEVQHRFGEKHRGDEDARDGGEWGWGLSYRQGPWGVGVGYNRDRIVWLNQAGSDVESNATLRVDYTAGHWRVGGYYQWMRSKQDLRDQSVYRFDMDIARLAAAYKLGASELHASVGRSRVSRDTDGNTGNAHVQWMLGYDYHLSSRTKLYATVTHTKHLPSRFLYESLWGALRYQGNFRSTAIGIRHSF